MRLWLKITIAVFFLSVLTSVSLSIFVNKQFQINLDKINFELSEALTKSISQSILDYVIEGNTRKTQEVLRRITKENYEIEYIVVIDFNNKLFASSVDLAVLPEELKNKNHLLCNSESAIKDHKFKLEEDVSGGRVYNYNNKKAYDYSHPFINNLPAHIHFGLKNSLYKESISAIRQYSIFITIIISVIGAIVAFVLGKRISRPIENLSSMISLFGKTGNYESNEIKTTDKDILKLVSSFKIMLKDRKNFELEISEYKDNLELLVEERTKRLEKEISQHQKTEEKLIQEKEISDKANNAKSDFLSSMSHELRTPLNAVLGFAQLMELENIESVHDHTKEILKAGYHLLALINDILDLSKIEAGKLELSIEDVSWNVVVSECLILLTSLIEEKNINFSINVDKTSEFIVRVDRVRLKQATLNLMSNAIKYNENSGSVIVSFNLNNNILRMTVKDTGKGIPDDKQHKLFSPFERLDMDKDAIDGVGIGLVITKALVESMHGEIGFKSEYGLGSAFWLEFPLERIDKVIPVNMSNDDIDKKDTIAIKSKSFPFDGVRKILYIEDNPSNMKVVESILKKYSNIEFYPAYNPSEAFNILHKVLPDLILLDINLPEMDGYEVKKILDQTPEFKTIKVVGVSANAMSHDIEKAMISGFSDYISKPIEINVFIDVVEKISCENIRVKK